MKWVKSMEKIATVTFCWKNFSANEAEQEQHEVSNGKFVSKCLQQCFSICLLELVVIHSELFLTPQ